MSDGHIIARAKKGDIQAFEELVRTYEKKVYNLALRYTNNGQDAFDISQEVFLRVYRALSGFKEESSFSTWLYQIAVNTCIDAVRKTSRRNEQRLTRSDEDADGQRQNDIADLSYSPEVHYDRQETREAIRAGIAKLSEEHRQVVILRDVNDLSYEEIGNILSLEAGTVKSRLFRAREKLRSILLKDGNLIGPNTSNKPKER